MAWHDVITRAGQLRETDDTRWEPRLSTSDLSRKLRAARLREVSAIAVESLMNAGV